MTVEQVKSLKLGIVPITDRTILIVESALEWVKENTTLEFDINKDKDLKALPSCVRLFVMKFFEINTLGAGVASESAEGLSQSFDTSDKNGMIWQFAEELLSPYLKGRVRFVTAVKKW